MEVDLLEAMENQSLNCFPNPVEYVRIVGTVLSLGADVIYRTDTGIELSDPGSR